MPSPFPGMDPYLEDPTIWPDFHNSLASHIRDALNGNLPEPYYAQLEVRSEVGLFDEEQRHVIIPDIGVREIESRRNGGVAVAEPRAELSSSVEILLEDEPVELCSVDVHDARTHQLVTLIEILSPSNKRAGTDRDNFLRKRVEILQSDASLVEIDLLRKGIRLWTNPEVTRKLGALTPSPDYLVLVNRAWTRGLDFRLQAFPIALTDTLPVVPVPLRKDEVEVRLDLQFIFQKVYDSGPYRRGAVDYSAEPRPALESAMQHWATKLIAAWLSR